jgi:hypothetical protein
VRVSSTILWQENSFILWQEIHGRSIELNLCLSITKGFYISQCYCSYVRGKAAVPGKFASYLSSFDLDLICLQNCLT